MKFTSVDEYIASFPEPIKALLEEMRAIVTRAAPEAEEVISYNMPAIKQNRVLVYYAAHKDHLGFYPTASPLIAFKKELAKYKTSKGAIQLPLKSPLPKKLIERIVKYREAEDAERAARTP